MTDDGRKTYRDMSDEEIEKVVRGIIRTSKTDEQIRTRIGEELGYPNPAGIAITSYRSDQGSMTSLTMYGPRGNMISF